MGVVNPIRRILLGENGPISPYFKEIKFKFAIFRPYNMLSKYSGVPKKFYFPLEKDLMTFG
jgi:hypothetical protein